MSATETGPASGDEVVAAVRAAVAAGADDMLAGLVEWLRIPSISGDPRTTATSDGRQSTSSMPCCGSGFPTVEVWETAGLPAVFAEWPSDDADAPTVLVYGHHDVQPVTPLDLWEHPPFEPTVVGERLYARGAADDKGQVWFHTLGLRAHLAATGRTSPAVNLKLIVEGEEESGSPNFAALLAENDVDRARLRRRRGLATRACGRARHRRSAPGCAA